MSRRVFTSVKREDRVLSEKAYRERGFAYHIESVPVDVQIQRFAESDRYGGSHRIDVERYRCECESVADNDKQYGSRGQHAAEDRRNGNKRNVSSYCARGICVSVCDTGTAVNI